MCDFGIVVVVVVVVVVVFRSEHCFFFVISCCPCLPVKGSVYNKKGRVDDIVSPTEFTVVLDDNARLLERVREDDVETAVPKAGGKVQIVRGKHKGETGVLLEKSSEQNKGVVQLVRFAEVVTCVLDDICGLSSAA